MASITIRNVDESLKRLLQARAAGHGQSMESEARNILREALEEGGSILAARSLYDAIRGVVEPLGGIEIDIPARSAIREAPKFE